MEEIVGTIEKFIFKSPDNGFSVFVIITGRNSDVTVSGHFPNLQPGQQVCLKGAWIMHPKFGKQFEGKECTVTLPSSIIGLKKYLASGMIKGIGPTYAERLVDHFGTSVLEIIDKEPQRLTEVAGIGQGRADKIKHAWQDQKQISSIMVFLQEKGISPAYAIKMYKTYGQNTLAVVQENPYRLADDIWGIGFKIADNIAHNLGLAKNSFMRIRAGLLFTITTALNNGHLYKELNALKQETIALLELVDDEAAPLLKQALHDLHTNEKIKLITYQDHHFITLSQYYFSEKGAAQKICSLMAYQTPLTFDLEAIYTNLRTQTKDIQLNDDQQAGIMSCLQHKISIITGGPGTGKTTLIKQLLAILDTSKVSYKLAAPTGRAAKRITEGTGRHASTLHRLLEFDFINRSFVHNEQNTLQLNMLIIDEASMIDIFLGHAVLKALPMHAHLVLLGDVDQLPSVGAGNFLNDIIASNKVPCTRLKHIFRQAQDSLIIVNAHKINNGEFPVSFLPDAKKDFIFIKEDDPAMVQHHLEHIFTETLRQQYIASHDATVLVPMNRGTVGTQKLNHDLQTILNNTVTENKLMRHGSEFKINDRVMQIRNNYDKKVFNGDIGTIQEINHADQLVIINYHDRLVEYDFSDLDELVLAYAITIHKSQGSEYAAAIIPIFMQHFTLLQRNLIYTAITRAKKLCIFIGQPKAIAMAIKNNKGVERTTFLQQFLTTDLACR